MLPVHMLACALFPHCRSSTSDLQSCQYATHILLVLQVFDHNRTGTATPMQSPTDTHMTTPGSVANEAEREPPGCGLGLNVDVMVCRAEWYYHVGAYQVSVHVDSTAVLLLLLLLLLGCSAA